MAGLGAGREASPRLRSSRKPLLKTQAALRNLGIPTWEFSKAC